MYGSVVGLNASGVNGSRFLELGLALSVLRARVFGLRFRGLQLDLSLLVLQGSVP